MPLHSTIHRVFSGIASQVPDCIAILGDGDPVTYGELARRADRIAAYLIARGVTPGARVGLYAPRGANAIAAMLGILRAGGAFVPFDPAYPPKLLEFVYQDSAPLVMFTHRTLIEETGTPRFWSGDSVDIGAEFPDLPPPAVSGVDRDSPAYIMYTSGSTGRPKGVITPHRGVVRLVIDNTFAEMNRRQVHLQLAPLAFDASTFEIWGALLNGAKLAVVPATHPSLEDIAEAIRRHGVTTLWLTAGLFHLMVDHCLDGLKPLEQLLAGGDVLSPPHVAKALSALPGCRIINGYGPTENTTFTCCYSIPHAGWGTRGVPIGKAIAHTDVYVLDDSGQPVAEGEEGELYAGGAGVALGYLNRPELTAERFLKNPFDPGARELMYRTGDRVRRRPDGNLEFLGRVDRQVKINGKRVELDEIEACIRRSPGVEDAAVTCQTSATGARALFAYVKFRRGERGSAGELRRALRGELPEYMVPASIFALDSLPLSVTGKVDRAKLPPPETLIEQGTRGLERAAGEGLEASLLGIWREVLGRESIGLDDNFFDLGGTSLQLIQAHATIRSVMKTDVDVVDLFQFPSIGALAAHLSAHSAPESRPRPAGAASAGGAVSAEERARRRQAALARARPRARRHP